LLIDRVNVASERPATEGDLERSHELLHNSQKALDNFASFQDDQVDVPLVTHRVNIVDAEEK